LPTATPDALAGAAEDRDVLTAELLHPPTAMSALASAKPATAARRASLRERAGQRRDLPGLSRRGDDRDRPDMALLLPRPLAQKLTLHGTPGRLPGFLSASSRVGGEQDGTDSRRAAAGFSLDHCVPRPRMG
jgi:hypothetical protein